MPLLLSSAPLVSSLSGVALPSVGWEASHIQGGGLGKCPGAGVRRRPARYKVACRVGKKRNECSSQLCWLCAETWENFVIHWWTAMDVHTASVEYFTRGCHLKYLRLFIPLPLSTEFLILQGTADKKARIFFFFNAMSLTTVTISVCSVFLGRNHLWCLHPSFGCLLVFSHTRWGRG